MRQTQIPIAILFFVLYCTISYAQLATGQWNTHMSYVNGQKLAISGNKVYCVASGSLFAYGLNDNSTETYTKANGLSDVYINDIAYCNKTETLVICYDNGNIDLMSASGIINLPDLKLKAIYGSKTINKIDIYDGIAYISADFGAMKLNIERAEISETYTLTNGDANSVNGIAVLDNDIYAATNNGLYKASLNSVNLQNFAEWSLVESIPNVRNSAIAITIFNSELIVTQYSDNNDSQYQVFRLEQSKWKLLVALGSFSEFGSNSNLLALACGSVVLTYNTNFQLEDQIKTYNYTSPEYSSQKYLNAYHAIPNNEKLFIADQYQGLIIYETGQQTLSEYPKGPATNTIWDINITQGLLRTVHGAVEQDYYFTRTAGAVSTYTNQSWSFIDTRRGVPAHPWGSDMVAIATDPSDLNRYYVNGYHQGLMEFYNDEMVARYNKNNSPIQVVPNDPGATRTMGATFDNDNNLWITNCYVDQKIHMMNTDGEWFSFSISGADDATTVEKIAFTDNGNIWITTPYWGKGIIALDHNNTLSENTDDQSKYFSIYANNNSTTEFVSDNVFEIQKDKDGHLWVGTNNGIAIYYNPENIFDSNETPLASRPNIPRNDGTGLGDYLLANETVFDIAVDGGNRKWLATESSGVYLVSADGLDELLHFTEENSPLLSNTVRVVEVNDETGEVFFGTEAGLISYQADATSGNTDFSDMKIYPNPVREDFFGDITITGLVDETIVKITDVSGNLVNQTTSNGGTATWNCKNFYGERVGTGVYLIFCSDQEGNQSAMTKVMVIN